MRQIVQNYRSGELLLVDVPAPQAKPGGVLVRTLHSLISTGTEMMKVGESRLSLVGKAKARPDQMKKVVQSVIQQGFTATYRKVDSQLDSWTPLGYSLAGEVVAVGAGVAEFTVGQLVACAGNEYAFHAELNWVPANLCVSVPSGVDSRSAAFTTVGAVAMQGFRQSKATLGEVAVVIGLGLVGQLLTQILRAAGLSIIGVDPSTDRCRLAERLGASAAAPPGGNEMDALETRLRDLTNGHGADHIFLTAGGNSNDPIELAARLARDRGRVVDIGKTRLDLPWKDFYEKELDVRFSRSYGPGRYDTSYEEKGIDYPIGYVRWTERRNMESFVTLLERGDVDVKPLIAAIYPFEEAVKAYEKIGSGDETGVGILFEYDEGSSQVQRLSFTRSTSRNAHRVMRLSVIGAGNYASSMLLPHLNRHPMVQLREVVTTTGLSAANAHRKFGFEGFGTDSILAVSATDVDAVLIATRHASHAELVCQALEHGKAVFVEKPLATNAEQLRQIANTIEVTGNDRLMVGFNRRFAPLLKNLKDQWGNAGPIHFRYEVNAGKLDARSWYGESQHGSRFVGEGGHFIDTASWWIGAEPVEVTAVALPADRDNVVVTLRYSDGSAASISYMTDGNSRYPKELIHVFGQGRVATFDNFRSYELWHGNKRVRNRMRVDKGQRHALDSFIDAVIDGLDMPIATESLIQTTAASIAAEQSATAGVPVKVDSVMTNSDAALSSTYIDTVESGPETPAIDRNHSISG